MHVAMIERRSGIGLLVLLTISAIVATFGEGTNVFLDECEPIAITSKKKPNRESNKKSNKESNKEPSEYVGAEA